MIKFKQSILVIITVAIIMFTIIGAWAADMDIVRLADYGAIGDGVTDDTLALVTAFNAAKGRKIFFKNDAKYFITGQIMIPDDVIVEGNGALIVYSPNLNENALSIRSSNVTIRNMKIRPKNVTAGPNGATRMPIVIGEYGNTFGNKHYANITLENITIEGGYVGMNGISVFGDASAIHMKNIHVIGSSQNGYASIGILVHWSANNTKHPNVTYHPHDIYIKDSTFENVAVGTTQEQSSCIFLSGAYNVSITNIYAKNINTGIYVYPGDYGFKFARLTDGNLVRNVYVLDSVFDGVRKYGVRVLGQANGKGPDLYMGVTISNMMINDYETPASTSIKIDNVSDGISIK